ncbi:MurR/RpiR family transcriptional regulator, partial [Cronobacter sakazakii]
MANNPTQLSILQDEIRRRYDDLSKRLKQVARYILDNSNSVAFDTVASIARQADVPPSTLIRFANAFGFSGFNEMKQMFRQHLMEETANYTERARLFRQTASEETSAPETPGEILSMFTMVNTQALQQLAMQMAPEELEKAV